MTRVIGITGGIASGKSLVTTYLRERGYPVIDADALVHALQARGGELYTLLLKECGQDILGADGELNRAKLAQVFFEDEALRKRLTQLQAASIRQALLAERDRLLPVTPLLFMDIPLLYEAGYEKEVDEVWLLDVDEAVQLQRLMKRNRLSEAEAKKRIASQIPLAEKRQRAHRLIDNRGSKKATMVQVEQLLREVEGR